MVERRDEEENGCYCKAGGEDNGYDDYEDEMTYVIRRLMLTPEQEEKT